jgi:hypothetical protein
VRLAAPRGGLDELAPDPGGRRVGGDIEVDQLPPAVSYEEQRTVCER